jgi:hypothetical protein
MIDIRRETLLTFMRATSLLPRRRRGRKCHVSTLYRWSTVGVRGVVLESIQVGGTRCTSEEALQRFFEALSGVEPNVVGGTDAARGPAYRSLDRRQRASERAEEALKNDGA